MSHINILRFMRANMPCFIALAFIALAVMMPDLAHATETGAGDLPFEAPLKKLTASLTGPVAFGISLIGIIAAGAALIFGGEMSGFLRSMVFLVLVIAVIVNASGIITMIRSDAAVIATYFDVHAVGVIERIRGLG